MNNTFDITQAIKNFFSREEKSGILLLIFATLALIVVNSPLQSIYFDLKYASPGFLPALATPFNFVYSKADMEKHGMAWHQKNINGTGAFSFVQHQPGAFVEGKARPGYHHMGSDGKPLPYLDGYKAISAPKMADRG